MITNYGFSLILVIGRHAAYKVKKKVICLGAKLKCKSSERQHSTHNKFL